MSWNLGFLKRPAVPAPTRSVSPSTAGNELMPAVAFAVQSVAPVWVSKA